MTKYLPDYYRILQINTDADKKEIKKAYKRLSEKYDGTSNKKTKDNRMNKFINDAYTVLSDDDKRKKYDKIRREALKSKKNTIKKNKINSTVDLANNAKDAYDLISKFSEILSPVKGKALLTGPNLIMGGAMAGYGIKKGRDYMNKRKRQNKK